MNSPMTECRETRPLVAGYVAGRLAAPAGRQVAAHLASCVACRGIRASASSSAPSTGPG